MPRPTDSAPGNAPAADGERIAKLLARAGVASRREVERMIAEGRVAQGGVTIATPATLLADLAGVTVDGNPVDAPAPARLFLYHKPTGLLVTERDPAGRPTIYDRLPNDLPRVVPVGRLDLNTEGLLLLTTDGGLKRQLELPASGVERTYRARAYGPVSQAQLEELIEGVEIDGIRYGQIDANLERRTGANSWIELTLTEGRNREVRRVLEHLGLEVGRLIRTRYGPFVLGDLPAGEVGEVRASDLAAFRQALAARRPEAGVRQERASREAPAAVAGYSPIAAAPVARSAPRTRSVRENKPIPGEGRGPVAVGSAKARPPRPPAKPRVREESDRDLASSSTARLDPGRRRGLAGKVPAQSKAAPETPTRPAKLQRKPGWAKPKPKAGPSRPRKR